MNINTLLIIRIEVLCISSKNSLREMHGKPYIVLVRYMIYGKLSILYNLNLSRLTIKL